MSNGTDHFRNLQISEKKDNLERFTTEMFEMNSVFGNILFHLFSEILVEMNAPNN